jgi:hypothetical protein
MNLLVHVGHVKSRFSPFGDSVQLGAQFARNVPLAQKIALHAPDGTAR